MLRRVILSILGIVLIISAYMLASSLIANKKKRKPIAKKIVKTVFVDTVKNTNIPISISASGNLVAKRRIELFSEVQGVFTPQGSKRVFKPGQIYKKGQTLIHIDASEYYATVKAAKSNLYNAIAAIMPDLQLDFPEAYTKWQNYLSAFTIEHTTPSLPETSSEKEHYFITGRGIMANYYNVKNLEQRLSKYQINAPFTGILTEALVTEGALVRNGQKLGTFIDTSVYELEVAVSAQYASFLKTGKPVTLRTLDHTKLYQGKVTRVNGSVDRSTQTITAFIELKHPDLKEGMYLEAALNVRTIDTAIEINRVLLSERNTIFVVRDSILDTVPVTPVFFSDKKVVLKAVKDGTVIVNKPIPGAYAGMLVKPFSDTNL